MKPQLKVLIKGAGELATGVAWRLHQSHFHVLMTEISEPLAIRRAVSFCEAVYERRKVVEGVETTLIDHPEKTNQIWAHSQIPLLIDPNLDMMNQIQPDILIEATLSKKNTGIQMKDAPLVIALGPGYNAGQDAHIVVETNRGHHLGRLYTSGYAQADTGIPGRIAGFSEERVLRAPVNGIFEARIELGDQVVVDELIATVAGEPITARIPGVVRGLIRTHTQVKSGLKIGDIDPRGDKSYVGTISEKARAISGSVLEAICRRYNT